jgi:hypothetical protein
LDVWFLLLLAGRRSDALVGQLATRIKMASLYAYASLLDCCIPEQHCTIHRLKAVAAASKLACRQLLQS